MSEDTSENAVPAELSEEVAPETGSSPAEEGKPVGEASVVDMDAVDPFPPHDESVETSQ